MVSVEIFPINKWKSRHSLETDFLTWETIHERDGRAKLWELHTDKIKLDYASHQALK